MTIAFRALAGLTLGALLLTPGSARAQNPAGAGGASVPMPSFTSLFSDLPADLRRLPAVANAAWLGGGAGLALAVHSADDTISQGASGSVRLEEFLDSGEPVGSGVVQGGAALATYLAGRWSHRPKVAMLGASLVRAQIINAGLTHTIKVIAHRPRPDGGSFSFPSGHTAASFATATVVHRQFGWKAGVPAYAIATYVAASRLSENAHFCSDVIFGAAVGVVSGRVVSLGGRTHPFAFTPALSPHEFALLLTKVERR